jgi:hypothetical protein
MVSASLEAAPMLIKAVPAFVISQHERASIVAMFCPGLRFGVRTIHALFGLS